MNFEGWYILLGALMLVVTFLDRWVSRLPITTTIIYLAVGIAVGPLGFDLVRLDPLKDSRLLEFLTEVAVLISLFTAGLKLRAAFSHNRWRLPLHLAFVSMALTIGLLALFAWGVLGLPVGAAILLGAILAPTDPVLASEVQLEHPGHRDRLRFSLTGEAGLNDGTAFPFVMLGLGLLGLHNLGTGAMRWVMVDLIWAVLGGLAIGGALGTFVGKMIVHLRNKHQETLGRDEFICLGLIGFAYGAALYLKTYGFLAVFAAGLALRRIELQSTGPEPQEQAPQEAPKAGEKIEDPENTPVHMARAVLNANEQLERIVEVGMVLIIGVMLSTSHLSWEAVWLALALFFVIRPVAVMVGTWKQEATGVQKLLLCWFGVRGIGSLYYLMYAIQHGLSEPLSAQLTGLVVCVITLSIFLHGISVTPLMSLYKGSKKAP